MFKKVLIAAIVAILAVPILWVGFPYYTARTVEIVVTGKERVPDGDDGSYYLVFTEDEVFQNVDAWRRLKTTSSDLQGRLQEGRRFEVVVYGWRIPILSKYRNIASIKTEITPAMGTAPSLSDLKPRVDRAVETKLPAALLFPQVSTPDDLGNALEEQFPEVTVRVFGEEAPELWGIMIYWDEALGTVLEATPMALDGEASSLEWGPDR